MDRDQMSDELFLESGRNNYRRQHPEKLNEEQLLQKAVQILSKLGCTEHGFNSFRKMSESKAASIQWMPAPEIHPQCDKAMLDGEWIYNLPHNSFPSMDYYPPAISRKYC